MCEVGVRNFGGITIVIVSNYQPAILLLVMLQKMNKKETIQASIIHYEFVSCKVEGNISSVGPDFLLYLPWQSLLR